MESISLQQHILLLQSILSESSVGIAFVSGTDFVFRLANPAYQRLIAEPGRQIIGLPYREVWPPNNDFSGENLLREAVQSGRMIELDRFEQRFPDGTRRGFSIHISPQSWYKEPAALIYLQDATQAEHNPKTALVVAEEAQRRADQLDAIIMAMAEAVILFDNQGRAERANPAAIELFGFDPETIEPAELVDILGIRHSDGTPVSVDELPSEQALCGGTVFGQQFLLIDADGQERIVRASASPLLSESTVYGAVTLWHDVTEREQLLEELNIERSRLSTIIENAPEAIVVVDEEGRFVLANPAAERMLGRPLPYNQEFEAHARLMIRHNDGTPYDSRNLPLVCSALDGERINDIELLIQLPDGSQRILLSSSAPIVDRYGNVNGAVGVFQDITQRKQNEENLRRQAARSQLLNFLSQAFAEAGLNFRELLETIVDQVRSVFGDFCSLHLISEDGQWHYPAAVSFDDPEWLRSLRLLTQQAHFPIESGMAGQVFMTGQPLVLVNQPVAQIAEILPPQFQPLIKPFLSETMQGLVVPLRAHGRWVGVLSVLRVRKAGPFNREDQAFLQDLADRAALAVEDARLYERETQRARELHALNQATTALLSTIDLETLLEQILESARNAIPAAEEGVLCLFSSKTQQLEVRAAFVQKDRQVLSQPVQPHLEAAIQTRRALIAPITEPDQPPCSAMIAPLILADRVLGVLMLIAPQTVLFTEDDLRLLDSFAATSTAALQNATLYAEVQRLATTDTLTEQYNRGKFFELGELEIHRFRRFNNPLSAIMLDVDNFKEINDTYGHSTGDFILHEIAMRIRANIRVIDILGRYGGDEFAILLPNAELYEANEIAERVRMAATSKAVVTDRGEVFVSLSLGVTQATPNTDNLSSLLDRADSALYAAKQSGRNRIELR